MKKLLRILKEYRFIRTVNVIYTKQDGPRDGETLLIERDFAYNLPSKGDAVIIDGEHYRVGTKWHDKDNNFIEIDLLDL